jgi:hypothetical protein
LPTRPPSGSIVADPAAVGFDCSLVPSPGATGTEAFKRSAPDREDMSQATKIVLGTVGLSVVLVLLLIAVAAFG